MGTYSYVDDYELEVMNKVGLRLYALQCKKGTLYDGKLSSFIDCVLRSEYQGEYTEDDEMFSLTDDFLNPDHHIIDIDGHKVIDYWYDEFVTLMRDLSAFVEGNITMTSETGDSRAEIIFEEGKTEIRVGIINWEGLYIEDAIYEEPPMVKRARLLQDV